MSGFNYIKISAYMDKPETAAELKQLFSNIEIDNTKEGTQKLELAGLQIGDSFKYLHEIQSENRDTRLQLLLTTTTATRDFDRGFFSSLVKKGACYIIVDDYDEENFNRDLYGFVGGKERTIETVLKHVKNMDPDFALQEGVAKGKKNIVQAALDEGANPDAGIHYPVILDAIRRERKGIVQLLLKAGADINGAHKMSANSGLFYLTDNKNCKFVEFLLDNNANVNIQNNKGETVLMMSAASDDCKMVETLLEHGADVSLKDNDGQTAIMKGCVEELIKRGAVVSDVDNSGISVMQHWAKSKYANTLHEHGVPYYIPVEEYNGNAEEDIFTAIDFAHVEKLEELLLSGFDPNTIRKNNEQGRDDIPLLSAAYAYRPEITELLLKYGADPDITNADGDTALSDAVLYGNEEVVEKLLAYGADINKFSSSYNDLLHTSVGFSCNAKITKMLIEQGIDITVKNEQGETALVYVLSSYNSESEQEVIQVLIDAGALEKEPNKSKLMSQALSARNQYIVDNILKSGMKVNPTFLSEAIYSCDKKIFDLIVERDVDIDAKSDRQQPLIAILCRYEHTDITSEDRAQLLQMFDSLLEMGADINVIDHIYHYTVLGKLQLIKGLAKQVSLVLQGGADLNQPCPCDLKGIDYNPDVCPTPLMIAAHKGYVENVEILLEAGADSTIRDGEGRTALDYARIAKRKNTSRLLEE